MDKKFVFTGKGGGTALIKNGVAEIKISPTNPLSQEEYFDVFASCDGRLSYLGKLSENCGRLPAKEKNTGALAIVRKNRKSGTGTVEMWGERRMGSEEFFQPKAKLEKSEKSENYFDRKTVFTFDNFLNMDFLWQKINGYVMPCNYKIMKYVMSFENVYRSINSGGHYMLGVCDEDGVHYIAVAVPVLKNITNPFGKMEEKTFKIDDGKIMYKAICMGIDESGEFFVCL